VLYVHSTVAGYYQELIQFISIDLRTGHPFVGDQAIAPMSPWPEAYIPAWFDNLIYVATTDQFVGIEWENILFGHAETDGLPVNQWIIHFAIYQNIDQFDQFDVVSPPALNVTITMPYEEFTPAGIQSVVNEAAAIIYLTVFFNNPSRPVWLMTYDIAQQAITQNVTISFIDRYSNYAGFYELVYSQQRNALYGVVYTSDPTFVWSINQIIQIDPNTGKYTVICTPSPASANFYVSHWYNMAFDDATGLMWYLIGSTDVQTNDRYLFSMGITHGNISSNVTIATEKVAASLHMYLLPAQSTAVTAAA